jgi:hypothetical protein
VFPPHLPLEATTTHLKGESKPEHASSELSHYRKFDLRRLPRFYTDGFFVRDVGVGLSKGGEPCDRQPRWTYANGSRRPSLCRRRSFAMWALPTSIMTDYLMVLGQHLC